MIGSFVSVSLYLSTRTETGLQRLFSSFPDGWPGFGLLILRTVCSLTLVIQGLSYAVESGVTKFDHLFIGVLVTLAGLSFLAGLLTPIASVIVMFAGIIFALAWIPSPSINLFDSKLVSVFVVAIAVAIGLLGPGAFSFDARLFGRREIFIPADTTPPKQ